MSFKSIKSIGDRSQFDWLTAEPKLNLDYSSDDGDKKTLASVPRPLYRTPAVEKAFKVYTVNQESRYIVIKNIPAIGEGILDDLNAQLNQIGPVEECRPMDEVDAAPFTDLLWVQFQSITSARLAKSRLVRKPFYGNMLKVVYAPEYETLQDVRDKLRQRKELLLSRSSAQAKRLHQIEPAYGAQPNRSSHSKADSREAEDTAAAPASNSQLLPVVGPQPLSGTKRDYLEETSALIRRQVILNKPGSAQIPVPVTDKSSVGSDIAAQSKKRRRI